MQVAIGTALVICSTFLLAVFAIASALAPPTSLDSRDIFIFEIGGTGVALAVLAFREFRKVSRRLASASA